MAIFLDEKELNEAYISAEQEARRYFEPFDEYERLSANRVRDNLPKNYPRVNDGTLASLLLENAKRVFPKLYTGRFTVLDNDAQWLVELINILWTRVLIPGAQADADFYTKFWNMHYRCQQYGAAVAFSFFSTRDNYTGADFTLDYIRDVLPEPGKLSHQSSNYIWRNTYHTKLDLLRIIDFAEKEQDSAKSEKRDSYSTWDVDLLKQFVNNGPGGKDAQNKNLTEREKQLAATHFKMATCFHRGFNAPFFTTIPSLEGKTVRKRLNENPTGDTPITVMYHTQDLVNPYGKGLVEVGGAGQNVLDYFTQADVLATQKGLSPPVMVKGTERTGFQPRSIVHGPNAQWFVGSMDVKTVETANSIYGFLENRIGRYKGNLMNQLGAFDTSVSSSAGNPQFSKTDAGVHKLDSRENVNDNFFATNGSIAYRQLAKNQMNIHLANMRGQEVFTLLEDEVERLQRAGWDLRGSTRALLVYKDIQGKVDFEVDDPTQSDDPETEGLLAGIKLLTENEQAIPSIESDGKFKVDLGEMFRQYFGKLKLSKLDKIIIPLDAESSGAADGAGAAQDQATDAGQDVGQSPQQVTSTGQQPQVPQSGQVQGRPPSESINYKDAPPLIQAQMEVQAGFHPDPSHAAEMQTALNPAQQQQAPQPVAQGSPAAQQPQPNDPAAAVRLEHAKTMQQYNTDPTRAAVIMAVRRQGIPETQIQSYMQSQGGKQ